MRIRTDDEVYRVDAVWLGPPRATMPWRARYVAWGVGVVVFLLVLTVERRIGVSLFWSIGWGLVFTILITRIICARISHERPLSAVLTMWTRELLAPRERSAGIGGAASATRLRVRVVRPRPVPRGQKRSRTAGQRQQKLQPQRNASSRRRDRARGREAGGVRTRT